MKIRKLIHGWRASFIWEWSHLFRTKMFYFTPCHVGFEAGTYKGNYIELVVVVLGVGFYVEWYPPTDNKKEFFDGMNAIIAEHKSNTRSKQHDQQSVCE